MSPRGALILLAAAVAIVCAAASPALAARHHHRSGAHRLKCGAVKITPTHRLSPGGTFGARNLTAAGTDCDTARNIAQRYVENPYEVSGTHRTRRLSGWRCTWQADSSVAQRVEVTCVRDGASIHFADLLPSG